VPLLFALDQQLIVSSAALLTSLILVSRETLLQARLLSVALSAATLSMALVHVSIAAMIDSEHGFCLWGTSRLHDAVLPLFEGAQPRTQRCPPFFSFSASGGYSAVARLPLRRAASR